MPFNIALTGLRAANVDLEVTGNNIANAGTTGFKESRVEFGDLYANAFLGLSQNRSGDGVRVQNIKQEFNQGNITFTDNALDLAVDGNGFFVMNSVNSETLYTRAGAFFVDKDGGIVNSQGSQLRGFPANEEGVVSGVLDELSVSNTSLPPVRTTDVDLNLNLDASEDILVERLESFVSDGAAIGQLLGPAPADNGYPAQSLDFNYEDGAVESINLPAAASANDIASILSTLTDVSASAVTTLTLDDAGFTAPTGTAGMSIVVDGVQFDGITSLSDLGNSINSSSALVGVSAIIDENDDLIITQGRGNDLAFEVITMDGGAMTLEGGGTTVADGNDFIKGGEITVTFDSSITVTDPAAAGNPFSTLGGTSVVNNEFDPLDEETYNHATSTTVFDSLGNSHVLTMYFVKESAASGTASNNWLMYTLIDGEDVGDPLDVDDPSSPATRASYQLTFNNDGTLDENFVPPVITNWTPLDPEGNPNGADGPFNRENNAAEDLITDPPTSSNFTIDISKITQYGSAFSVLDLQQDGYTTGLLNGLDVAQNGTIFARYSNGESQVLGQVALANFNSVDGLAPVGETAWVETFASGGPVIGPPGSASLGTIAASSLEESNVDLSEELVSLIVAQRNYQANAKTIETANATTQTIINLR